MKLSGAIGMGRLASHLKVLQPFFFICLAQFAIARCVYEKYNGDQFGIGKNIFSCLLMQVNDMYVFGREQRRWFLAMYRHRCSCRNCVLIKCCFVSTLKLKR